MTAAETVQYHAPCPGCGTDATWHATHTTTRIDCPCAVVAEPEPVAVVEKLPNYVEWARRLGGLRRVG